MFPCLPIVPLCRFLLCCFFLGFLFLFQLRLRRYNWQNIRRSEERHLRCWLRAQPHDLFDDSWDIAFHDFSQWHSRVHSHLKVCNVYFREIRHSTLFLFISILKQNKSWKARFIKKKTNIFLDFRSVPPAQRSYALGIQMDLTRILGAIPGPIVFGALLDKTCILWNSK